jgi:heavy metal sensor kinase
MIKLVHSLQFRLTALFAGIFILCLVSIFLGLDAFLRRSLITRTDAALTAEISHFSDLASRRKDRIVQSDFNRFAQHYGEDRVFLRLQDAEGNIVAISATNGWNDPTFMATVPPFQPGTNTFRSFTINDTPIRSVYAYDINGRLLQIAHAIEADAALFSFFRRLMLSGLLLSLVLATTLVHFALSHATRRIDRVRAAAHGIASGRFFSRVPDSDHHDEIGELSRTFNFMLDRIEGLVRELQHLGVDIAHELRTPITRIRGTVEARVTAPAVSPDDLQALGIVLEECDNLALIIDSMLQIARLEAGQRPAVSDEIDMVALLTTALEAFSSLAEDAHIVLRSTLPLVATRVCGDSATLQRAFSNLLDNALKFTPADGQVEVHCEQTGSSVLVTVTDTGIGIHPDSLPHIFDRFYRDFRATARGTGLGLALVQAIVKVHGGTIRVESTLERGTSFFVSLPIART